MKAQKSDIVYVNKNGELIYRSLTGLLYDLIGVRNIGRVTFFKIEIKRRQNDY